MDLSWSLVQANPSSVILCMCVSLQTKKKPHPTGFFRQYYESNS